MTRALIEDILNRITSELPEIKRSGLFNDQFQKYEDGLIDAINFPAMFLSFPDEVTYLANGSGVQKSDDFTIRFYIGMKFVTDSDVLDIFDLKQRVYNVFNKFQPSSSGSMSRISEGTDEDRNGFYVFTQDYKAQLIDTETFVENEMIDLQVNNLSVDADLIIDPNTVDGVRTDIIQR